MQSGGILVQNLHKMKTKQINYAFPFSGIKEFGFVIILFTTCFFGVCNPMQSSARHGGDEVGRLMAFKNSSIEVDPKGFLKNWSQNSLSPCSWNGVLCSSNGGIIELNFTNAVLTGRLHLSDLLALPHLTAIHFSGNFFYGNLSFNAESCSLEILDLSNNNFTGDVISLDLGSCGNLTKLNLSFNRLEATEFPFSLANCQSLEEMDLSNNDLCLEIPGDLLGKMRNLRKMVLAKNEFYGAIPPQLGDLCGNLEVLDLSENQLTGGLPSTFANCSSLFSLNLGNNQLSGDFLGTVITSLTNLRYLHLSFNNINGSMPESLTNCTNLKILDLSANALTGSLPRSFCSGRAPYALENIMLSDNYLTEGIPSWLGLCRNLKVIDLSFNFLSGPIPREIWTLQKLSDIVMWANNITGEIPEGICIKGASLQTIILNNNFITGKIPNSIANCTNLVWLSLFSNRISGEIPSGIANLVNLSVLQLSDNSLTGGIPPELGKCRSLWLELNSNALTGTITSEVAKQTRLPVTGIATKRSIAFIRNEGTNCTVSSVLIELDGIRLQRLSDFHEFKNCPSSTIYTGDLYLPYTRNGSMILIDLSHNYLSGPIPQTIGSMDSLHILNLGHNMLTGNIPYCFGNLKSLGILDLSYNDLDGSIPGSLRMLSFLSGIDVSNNNLTGRIPHGGQFSKFPSSRFENNSGLCGIPLPDCNSNGNAGQRPEFEGQGMMHSSSFFDGFSFHFLLGFFPFFFMSCFSTFCLDFKFATLERYRQKVHKRTRK